MQVQQTREVACPTCDESMTVPVPDGDVELKVRPYVAAFGDYTTLECSSEHTVWVYFC